MDDKDWTGDSGSVYKTLGSRTKSYIRPQHDFYATDPKAVDLLCENEAFDGGIWECACGTGHISKRLEELGHSVISSDLVYRGYGLNGSHDFFTTPLPKPELNIVTNPPYKYAREFVERALDIVADGKKAAMFLRLLFLESKARKKLFLKHPPKTVYVSSSRLRCAKNGVFDKGIAAMAFAWFVWEKGYTGETKIKWVN